MQLRQLARREIKPIGMSVTKMPVIQFLGFIFTLNELNVLKLPQFGSQNQLQGAAFFSRNTQFSLFEENWGCWTYLIGLVNS